jgi:hypothetical protein
MENNFMARTPIGTPTKAFRVTDSEAVQLINEKARQESRSAANMAALVIIESLSNKDNQPTKKSNH